MNSFSYNGYIEDSTSKIQIEFITLQETDEKPEIVGIFASYNPQTGEEEIYFNISSYIKLNNCTLQYSYSFNDIFYGPFVNSMEYINKTFWGMHYYSLWYSKINLPIFPEYKEYSFIIYESVLIMDFDGNYYQIELPPGEITATNKSYIQTNFLAVLMVFTFIIPLSVGIIILKTLKRKRVLLD
ncbi:MAG: hypothetical protein MUP85_22045 [Candidatus Lokiarchaeota archaeon]|nr:hypothetical protein [Candidatus Lokiarchaeota archaeon]